jgi:hypothetical protein
MHSAVHLACVVSATVLALLTGHPTAGRLVASDDKPDETIIDAREGDVVRLSRHQRARLDALTVTYEGTGELKTEQRAYVAFALITLRYGRHSAQRMARLREAWTWNGYVVEVLGIDSHHARVKLRHARRLTAGRRRRIIWGTEDASPGSPGR